MDGKSDRILRGVLMYPLEVGKRALIFHEGQYIQTTPVQAVHSVDPHLIRFETLNTNYHLLAPLSPQTAAPPLLAVDQAA